MALPDRPNLLFAHVAYRFGERYAARGGALPWVEARSMDELAARIAEADVLLVSGLWRDVLIAQAPRLRLIQSISAGVDQYGKDALRGAGIRLASAQGANANAVSEHAMALILALCCALTEETRGLMGAREFAAMKPGATLVNVARGRVCEEAALTAALASGHVGAAALDVTAEEPLPAESPLWAMPSVLITPHTGGETRSYEDNVLDLMEENIARLTRGETALRNEVI